MSNTVRRIVSILLAVARGILGVQSGCSCNHDSDRKEEIIPPSDGSDLDIHKEWNHKHYRCLNGIGIACDSKSSKDDSLGDDSGEG